VHSCLFFFWRAGSSGIQGYEPDVIRSATRAGRSPNKSSASSGTTAMNVSPVRCQKLDDLLHFGRYNSLFLRFSFIKEQKQKKNRKTDRRTYVIHSYLVQMKTGLTFGRTSSAVAVRPSVHFIVNVKTPGIRVPKRAESSSSAHFTYNAWKAVLLSLITAR
jgi:hypothetical protein